MRRPPRATRTDNLSRHDALPICNWRPATLIKVDDPAAGRRVYSEETSRIMRGLLRMIVLKGTGRKGEAPGYRVGGKTGTAEKVTSGGGYSGRVKIGRASCRERGGQYT